MADSPDSFTAILERKAALKDAADNADVGTRPKEAVQRAKDAEAPAKPTEGNPDGPPDKYNMPRRDGESLSDHMARLSVMRAAYDRLHPREP